MKLENLIIILLVNNYLKCTKTSTTLKPLTETGSRTGLQMTLTNQTIKVPILICQILALTSMLQLLRRLGTKNRTKK